MARDGEIFVRGHDLAVVNRAGPARGAGIVSALKAGCVFEGPGWVGAAGKDRAVAVEGLANIDLPLAWGGRIPASRP